MTDDADDAPGASITSVVAELFRYRQAGKHLEHELLEQALSERRVQAARAALEYHRREIMAGTPDGAGLQAARSVPWRHLKHRSEVESLAISRVDISGWRSKSGDSHARQVATEAVEMVRIVGEATWVRSVDGSDMYVKPGDTPHDAYLRWRGGP